jgi:hypothetical protein
MRRKVSDRCASRCKKTEARQKTKSWSVVPGEGVEDAAFGVAEDEREKRGGMQIKRESTLCARQGGRTSVPVCSRIWGERGAWHRLLARRNTRVLSQLPWGPKTLFDGREWLCLWPTVHEDGSRQPPAGRFCPGANRRGVNITKILQPAIHAAVVAAVVCGPVRVGPHEADGIPDVTIEKQSVSLTAIASVAIKAKRA